MGTMQSVGKYQLIRELGKGATGKVYLADDPFAKRKVAIKVAFPEALKNSEDGAFYKSMFLTEAEAIALANATQYGLVAGVWTRDGGRQMRLAHALQAGQVFINDYGAGGGVELPFGGVKKSGHGREKGWAGLLGFTTLKTVAIRHG